MMGWDWHLRTAAITDLLFIPRINVSGEQWWWWWCRPGITPDFSTRARWQFYQQRHLERVIYPRIKDPGTHWTESWVGPRAGLDTEARGKILCLCQGSNLDRPVVQSVARHYTDWATPAPLKMQQKSTILIMSELHKCKQTLSALTHIRRDTHNSFA
jgi:hypothetical protein